jgi:DNA sulfur modification protein DndB
MKIATKLFSFEDAEVPENLRELQSIDINEVKAIMRRIRGDKNDYVLNSLIVVTDESVSFNQILKDQPNLGNLRISLEATLILCGGQAQQAALRELLNNGKMSQDDTVPVIIIPDPDFVRVANIYMGLNQSDGNRSQRVLIEDNALNQLVLELIETIPIFQGRIEKTRTTISNRSSALFTLSAVYQATQALLGVRDDEYLTKQQEHLAHNYWNEVGENILEWQQIIQGEVTASYLRQNFIHAHTVSLLALGIVGNSLLTEYPNDWRTRIIRLRGIDWSRRNITLWEGRAMVRGRMSKARDSVTLTVNTIKQVLDLPLSLKELELEQWIDG